MNSSSVEEENCHDCEDNESLNAMSNSIKVFILTCESQVESCPRNVDRLTCLIITKIIRRVCCVVWEVYLRAKGHFKTSKRQIIGLA
jgi:hypothetical protein